MSNYRVNLDGSNNRKDGESAAILKVTTLRKPSRNEIRRGMTDDVILSQLPLNLSAAGLQEFYDAAGELLLDYSLRFNVWALKITKQTKPILGAGLRKGDIVLLPWYTGQTTMTRLGTSARRKDAFNLEYPNPSLEPNKACTDELQDPHVYLSIYNLKDNAIPATPTEIATTYKHTQSKTRGGILDKYLKANYHLLSASLTVQHKQAVGDTFTKSDIDALLVEVQGRFNEFNQTMYDPTTDKARAKYLKEVNKHYANLLDIEELEGGVLIASVQKPKEVHAIAETNEDGEVVLRGKDGAVLGKMAVKPEDGAEAPSNFQIVE